MLRPLNKKEAIYLYQTQLQKDFKPQEIPPLSRYKNMLEGEGFTVLQYVEEGKEKAYFILRKQQQNILLFFFAVQENYRGQGIGSKCMKELQQSYEGCNIYIEVEAPEESTSEEEEKIRKRRIIFYERLGFVKIENIHYQLKGHAYHWMVLGKKVEAEEVIQMAKKMYDIQEKLPNWMKIAKKEEEKGGNR